MDMLSFIGRGFKCRSHDHGGCPNILAGSRKDRHLPLVLLDLIVYTACPCPCALSVEVLRARASVVATFMGLISFATPSSFQALLVILSLFL
jgi:hypothetical protein